MEGLLLDGINHMDMPRATFPADTLSGAPKIHAMELIDELEPSKRGVYGGACGHISYAGDMDLAIAIRTGIVKGGRLYTQAAASIADFVPGLSRLACAAPHRQGGDGGQQPPPEEPDGPPEGQEGTLPSEPPGQARGLLRKVRHRHRPSAQDLSVRPAQTDGA